MKAWQKCGAGQGCPMRQLAGRILPPPPQAGGTGRCRQSGSENSRTALEQPWNSRRTAQCILEQPGTAKKTGWLAGRLHHGLDDGSVGDVGVLDDDHHAVADHPALLLGAEALLQRGGRAGTAWGGRGQGRGRG